MAKVKYKKLTTGRGTLRYPKITQPDSRGEYADGKYKTDFVPDDLEALQAEVRAFAIEALGEKRGKVCRIPFAEKDDVEFFRAKSKDQPEIADIRGVPVEKVPNIGGGTIAKLKVSLATYPNDNPKDVTAYLNGVQIIKLKQFDGDTGFADASKELDDDEDGFQAEDADGNFTDESGDDNADDEPAEKPVKKETAKKGAGGKKNSAADF